MTDLTVLHAPNPLYSPPTGGLAFSFSRQASSRTLTPMVILEMADEGSSSIPSPVRSRDNSLLSPPINTFTSHPPRRRGSSVHLPRRPASAPPSATQFSFQVVDSGGVLASERPASRQRTVSSFASGSGLELVRPLPPLLRPRTFWRNTSRSGVTASSYSPSTHIIRRSSFIAAGLDFDKPIADPSALAIIPAMTRPGGLGSPHQLLHRDLPNDHQPIHHPDIDYRRHGDGSPPLDVAVPNDASSAGRKRIHIDKRETPISHWNINYGSRPRHESPLFFAPVPTTSFNWWPYPAWSATASLAAPSPLQTLPIITVTATNTAAPGTTNTDLSSTTTTDSSSTTSPTSSSSSATDSSTSSVVSISALPAATSNPSRSSTRDFNIVYLTPVFAVVGLALGALAAILGRRLYRRRRAARAPRTLSESSLEPGPPYMPAATFDENGMQDVDLHAASAGPRPGGYSRQSSAYSAAQLSPGTRNGLARNGSATTFNGLLAAPVGVRAASTHARSPSRASAQVTSPDQPSIYSFSEHEDAPYDAPGQSDIRRGILERLLVRSPSPVRGGNADTYAAVRVASPRSSVAGGGFRIVEEDPDAPSRAGTWRSPDDLQDAIDREASASWLAWTKAWSPASTQPTSPRSMAGEDKYTAVPARKAAADRKTPRIGSPAPAPARMAASMERNHSAVLSRSPPQVRSPPLDSQLLYSPTISTTAPLKTGRTRAGSATVVPRQAGSPRHKERKKMRTPNTPPPPLPFPASERDSPYRHRLSKPRPVVETASPTAADDSGASSIVSPVRATSPAERHAARKTALNKVEQIVAQSWSERDVNGVPTPRSPTLFGAIQHPNDNAMGIEQRLATVEEKDR